MDGGSEKRTLFDDGGGGEVKPEADGLFEEEKEEVAEDMTLILWVETFEPELDEEFSVVGMLTTILMMFQPLSVLLLASSSK